MEQETKKEISLNDLNDRMKRFEIGLILLMIGAVVLIVRTFMR